MKHRIIIFPGLILGLILGTLNAYAWADDTVSVEAHVDRTRVAPGESIQLTVTVYNGDGEVAMPDLTDFKVFSQGTATSVQMVNGRTSRQMTHNYLLVPQRQGELTIPAVSVTIDGKEYRTDPITITVTKAPAAQTAPSDREVWVTASVSNPSPFVGEQFAYRFSLFQSVRVTDATFDPPEFDGFTAKEIKERGSRRQIINGREFVVTEIYYVLVPVATGLQTIAPAVLNLGIVRPEQQRRRSSFDDFFNDPFFNRNRVEQRVLQTDPVAVDVQLLPPAPGGFAFSGLVGDFRMSADMETTELKAGDTTTLTITIQGKGNIMDAKAPALAIPDGIKTYEDTPEEDIHLTADGYRGKKVFRTALVPVTAGDIALPAATLTYFDAGSKQYRTLRAALPPLNVAPATEAQAAPNTVTPQSPQIRKHKVAFTGRDILPPKEALSALTSQHAMSPLLFLVWLLTPGCAVGVLALALRQGRKDDSPSARMRRHAQQSLKQAETRKADLDDFLTNLYQALTAAILARAGRQGQALTWKEAETILDHRGATQQTTTEATDLLKTLESAKFSDANLDEQRRETLLKQTRTMVKQLSNKS